MSAISFNEREAIAARCAGLLAQLGAENDRFRSFWNQADEPTRRLLLNIAKAPLFLSSEAWDAIGPETRGKVKRRAAELRDWLVRVLPA
jgi:hypothetical protein